MPSSYCFVLEINFCRPCVIVRELVVPPLQACISVVIVFLACNRSQSCYIKLCSYFCLFYFLLGLLCLVVCAFICLACLFICIFIALCLFHQSRLFCLSYSKYVCWLSVPFHFAFSPFALY